MEKDIRHWILLGIAAIALVKGLWCMGKPRSVQSFAGWWVRVVSKVNTLFGLLVILAGLAIWSLVLVHQQPVDWALLVLGAFILWGGTVYLRRIRFKELADAMILQRSPMGLRLTGLFTAVVAILLIWVALR